VGYLADLWLRIYRELSCEDRAAALEGQLLDPALEHDGESVAAASERAVQQIPPLPDSPAVKAESGGKNGIVPEPVRPLFDAMQKRILNRLVQEVARAPAEKE